MALYEIKISWYNHVSGSDSEIYSKRYTDLNTAKRKLLELVMSDENLDEEDAVCEISKDLLYAHCEGRRDYSDYYIQKTNIKVCTDKSSKVTDEELQKIINKNMNGYDSLQIQIV